MSAHEEYEDFEPDDGEGDAFEFDCHLDPSTGLCGAAGSEDCEFECPHRAERDRIRARVVGDDATAEDEEDDIAF